ncbi:Ppx/GppA family phosphatase [Eubacteriales bacterium OttesenSCG-928-N13]|nr:Ppx/GppA family phosphatase [Eubacteriales bacterium OttesenSCG-928-N13]
MLRVAALDVGSNSVRLLVADVRGGLFLPVLQDRITSRLYAGLKDGMLHPDSIARTADAIGQLAQRAREAGATEIYGYGTSAMRDGQNRDVLVQAAADMGVSLELLSGHQEAALSYLGAAPDGRAGVVDIGGGSTEIMAGEQGKVLAAASAQMGAVRLSEQMKDIIAPDEMVHRAMAVLAPIYAEVRHVPVDGWIGIGGTITSLAAMDLQLASYDAARIEHHPVTAELAHAWLIKLCGMTMKQRQQVTGMNPARADIMPYGTAILCAFFALSGAQQLLASDKDALTGSLLERFINLK